MNGIINIISTWNFENLQGLCGENLLGVGGGGDNSFCFFGFYYGRGELKKLDEEVQGCFCFLFSCWEC